LKGDDEVQDMATQISGGQQSIDAAPQAMELFISETVQPLPGKGAPHFLQKAAIPLEAHFNGRKHLGKHVENQHYFNSFLTTA